jgi:hypothetical protein
MCTQMFNNATGIYSTHARYHNSIATVHQMTISQMTQSKNILKCKHTVCTAHVDKLIVTGQLSNYYIHLSDTLKHVHARSQNVHKTF